MTFPRGFKTRCEALSLQVRSRLRLRPEAVLAPEALAEDLGVALWSPQDLSGLPGDVRRRLEGESRDEWSAVTISADTNPVIVFNPTHGRRRRASTLMHELAHVLLEHTPGNMFFGPSGLALRTHNPDQESEAAWLAGCLLLPRDALLAARKRGASDEEICESYGVSRDMLRFRINATGIDRQLGAARRRVPISSRIS